jgi:hypothetical protein
MCCDPVAMLDLLPDSAAFAPGSTAEARGRESRRVAAKNNVEAAPPEVN